MVRSDSNMPLEPGNSKSVISKNISEMEAHGHSKAQSVAAALHKAKDAAPKSVEPSLVAPRNALIVENQQ